MSHETPETPFENFDDDSSLTALELLERTITMLSPGDPVRRELMEIRASLPKTSSCSTSPSITTAESTSAAVTGRSDYCGARVLTDLGFGVRFDTVAKS